MRMAPQGALGSPLRAQHQHRGDLLPLSTTQRHLALLAIEAMQGLEHLDHQLQLTRGFRLREFAMLDPRGIAGFAQHNLAFHFRDLLLEGKHTAPFVRATSAEVSGTGQRLEAHGASRSHIGEGRSREARRRYNPVGRSAASQKSYRGC